MSYLSKLKMFIIKLISDSFNLNLYIDLIRELKKSKSLKLVFEEPTDDFYKSIELNNAIVISRASDDSIVGFKTDSLKSRINSVENLITDNEKLVFICDILSFSWTINSMIDTSLIDVPIEFVEGRCLSKFIIIAPAQKLKFYKNSNCIYQEKYHPLFNISSNLISHYSIRLHSTSYYSECWQKFVSLIDSSSQISLDITHTISKSWWCGGTNSYTNVQDSVENFILALPADNIVSITTPIRITKVYIWFIILFL